MAEADFFGLSELKEWILNKKYMEAVKTSLKMEVHPGQLNPLSEHKNNHAWLHSLPPRERLPIDPNLDKLWGNVWTTDGPPDHDPQNEDLELLSCIEVKILSRGNFKCPGGHKWHVSPEFCRCEEGGECLQGIDFYENDFHGEEGIDWSYEQVPTSIITVVKYVNYHTEKCLRG
jgi:hypothetical protein